MQSRFDDEMIKNALCFMFQLPDNVAKTYHIKYMQLWYAICYKKACVTHF